MKDKIIQLYMDNKELVGPAVILLLVILLLFSGNNETAV
jgi:hypothetical protein